jgi:hypothetical protein
MNSAQIEEAIDKLQYQVSLLRSTVDYDRNPIEALILDFDWGRGDIGKAHDIFERWEDRLGEGEAMSTAAFEQDFKRELDVSYQELKSIILAFYRNNQWTNVCSAYVDSFGKHPAVEYHSIMRRER